MQKTFVILFFIAVAALAGLSLQVLHQLPDVEALTSYIPSESTVILDLNGQVLARLHREENRRVVPLSKISPDFIKAVVTSEDPNFYKHHGLDFFGIGRAAVKNVIYGRIVEGGSTITQQLARNLFLTQKRTLTRKVGELILALQIEHRYTKEEILEMYLNQVYLGHNSYGVESAAELYFNKKAAQLNLAESTLLAGLIPAPELYSPYRNFKGAKTRQIHVLNIMLARGIITETAAQQAALEELEFSPKNLKRLGESAPYFISYVLKDLVDKYGEAEVYQGGLRVYTTLDSRLQSAAEEVISRFASAEGIKYNFSQAALISLDPRTGYIKAMVGGVDFYQSKFNRATQAKRQPGSAFKPFVYATAMEQGISPGTVLVDEPTVFEVYPNQWNPEGTWTPLNFNKKFAGPVTVRYALEKSLNIPSIKLMERVGIQNTINTAHRLGIQSRLEPGLALTLGVSEVTLLEITAAYGPLANSGIYVPPTALIKVENRDGVTLYKHTIEEKQALDPNIAAVTTDLMRGVLTRGTGARGQIGRPAAAKTGTNENFKDAWFIGFVPQLVTGVWVGNDDNTSMEGVAEVAICPRIWKEYNLRALAQEPALDFARPEGLVSKEICLKSGKLATKACPTATRRRDYFWKNDLPKEACALHQAMEELFNYDLVTDEVEP